MKKSSVVLLLLCLIYKADAQKFGVQAGATFYSFKDKIQSLDLNADSKIGITAGVTASLPINKKILFMPAFNFTQKGGTLTAFNDSSDNIKVHYTFNYLELPLNFVYNIDVKGGKIFVGAGPDIGWAIGGNQKAGSASVDINFGNSADDEFKALELSANVLAGYKFNSGFFVSANYNPGLSDISNAENDVTFHNRGFAIRVGIMFHGKKENKSTVTQ